MATILITGGTGLIGAALSKHLLSNLHNVIILSRSKRASDNPQLRYAQWNIEEQTIDKDAIAEADYIIHLAGANVAEKRWSAERKQEILQSRTKSGALLVKALRENTNKVKAVISSSAIGWYGPDTKQSPENPFKENAPFHNDYLGTTCKAWEDSLEGIEALHIRLVKLRTGIVLSKEGGALAEFMKPLRFGFATIMGNGKQIVSWIHIKDIIRMYDYAMLHDEISGVYNAVAPGPVSNKELVITMAEKMRGRFYMTMHAPAFALKVALGEMSVEILKSATVSAAKIQSTGFKFYFPTIQSAMEDFFGKK
jgi:uncharacterized protein